MKEIICSVWHLPGREDIYEFPESIELYHSIFLAEAAIQGDGG